MKPKPQEASIELNGHCYSFKAYLQNHSFSYRCKNNYKYQCPFLLTIPINELNFEPDTFKYLNAEGSFQASEKGHSQGCLNSIANLKGSSKLSRENSNTIQVEKTCIWQSNVNVLREFIKGNLPMTPTSIQIEMRKLKQEFTLLMIKKTKKVIYEEIFPQDTAIAFHPLQCKVIEAEDSFNDNLYRFHGSFITENKKKSTDRDRNSFEQHNYYIFSSRLMMYHLSHSDQWFIDGTFDVAPSGFKQLLIIIVYLPKHKIFYPAAYIILTGKSEALYHHAFANLNAIAIQQDLPLKPKLVMTDFEQGMRNAVMSVWNLKQEQMIGCFFHYVKALLTKAKTLGMMPRKQPNNQVKLLIGLLKIVAHCNNEERLQFFNEIEETFKTKGDSYKKFLEYFRKNWLNNTFLRLN